METTSEKQENSAFTDIPQSSKNNTNQLLFQGENVNTLPVKIIALQNMCVSPLKQNATSEEANLIVYGAVPIRPKPPGYQAPPIAINSEKFRKTISSVNKCNLEKLHKCDKCNKVYSKPSCLFRHKRVVHEPFVVSTDKPSSKKTFLCRVCDKYFASASNRRRHEKQFHQFNPEYKQHIKCSECLSAFSSRREIITHICDVHSNIDLKTEILTFKSSEEFQKWKVVIEKETASEYVLDQSYKTKDYTVQKYICHRSGQFRSHGVGKRRLKIGGSNKTGFFCPAKMHIKTCPGEDPSVEVTFLSTHTGHECEVERLKMANRLKYNQSCKLNHCRLCEKVYTDSHNRKLHEKAVHGFDEEFRLELKCPECLSVFPFRKEIIKHISKSHPAISMEPSYMTFACLDEFKEWKLSIEKNTGVEYVLDQAYKKKDYTVQRFNCHQSASNETETFCPASILIKSCPIKDRNVDVTFLSTHIGHEVNVLQVIGGSSVQNGKLSKSPVSIRNIHESAEEVVNNVTIIQSSQNEWIVLPFRNETEVYKVKMVDVDAEHSCKIKCLDCNICCHQFICSCVNSLLKHNICEHIHIVCLKSYQLLEESIEEFLEYGDNADESLQETCEVGKYTIFQENRENLQPKNLKEHTLSALSDLASEVEKITDEEQFTELIKGIHILKNNCSSFRKQEVTTISSPVRQEINNLLLVNQSKGCDDTYSNNHNFTYSQQLSNSVPISYTYL